MMRFEDFVQLDGYGEFQKMQHFDAFCNVFLFLHIEFAALLRLRLGSL